MSGSFKDLSKALNSSVPTLTLPLPDDILQIIHAYLEKHDTHDESDSQRLQEELFAVYQNHVLDKPSRMAPFLAILRHLTPGIRGSGRLLQWWDKLSLPILNKIGEEKGLAVEVKETLLGILAYDEDEDDEDAAITSSTVSENLLDVWLKKNFQILKDHDDEARFVEGQIKMVLFSFGRKRPKAFLNTINKFFVKKDSRILTLMMLCEFIRHQPPHLHQILETPLFENLLKCLQIDTSTRVISLAMTALIMVLPHVPNSIAKHLPALFKIYSRMLFWDRERRAISETSSDGYSEKNEKLPYPHEDSSWAKLSYLLESDDENVPELLHYFTFLYGLYPLNFMSYIRKPQRYLRHANLPDAEDLDVEPTELRQRSEPFRQVHLLHENFFMMTLESELTDNHRWIRSEAADVVADCMALYSPGEENHLYASRSRGPDMYKKVEPNADVPEDPLLDDSDAMTPYQSRHASWRNTQSTAVASPDECRNSGLHRKASLTSQSMPSIAGSPSLRASNYLDSPTLPPHMASTPSPTPLQDMLNSQRSTRGSLYQTLTNDSVHSLADSHPNNDSSFHVDAYLQSLTRDHVPRSPSLRPTNADPSLRVAYLHREIQLLRNDLNFERYLKQQHLSHIGQLRRKQIREARVEAETQNLINANRGLKLKIEEAKKTMVQMKKEGEKSKSHSRKWEENLSAKVRGLREEQKIWIKEKEELTRDLASVRDDAKKLLDLVVAAEARELQSSQKMQSIESNLDELERLRAEVEKLTLSVRTHEAREDYAEQARSNEDAAWNEVAVLKMQLKARDEEFLKYKSAFENEQRDLRRGEAEALNGHKTNDVPHDIYDSALTASRNRIVEVQKAHNHLLKRYNELQELNLDLKEQLDQAGEFSESPPLLSGALHSVSKPRLKHSESFRPQSPTPMVPESRRRNHTMSEADFESPNYPASGSSRFPGRMDTSYISRSPDETRSPVTGNAAHGAAQYHFGPGAHIGVGRGSIDTNSIPSLDGQGNPKPKIKPQSEVRVYGRGGVQNIGKKEKEPKKDKTKGKETESGNIGSDKKEKKVGGIRGIRGFV